MDRTPSPLFRQVAIEAAAGTPIGASLTTHWRGVAAFAGVALALLAALIAFVAVVEHAPVRRVAAFVSPHGRVVLLLPASAVASVTPGIDVRLAFRAYPQERFGLFPATVDRVDKFPTPPGDVPGAALANEPMFAAFASLPGGTLHGPHGDILPLEPGMLGDALVPMQRRTLLAWLVDAVRGPSEHVVALRSAAEIRR